MNRHERRKAKKMTNKDVESARRIFEALSKGEPLTGSHRGISDEDAAVKRGKQKLESIH